jgi:hypothetical protein
MRGQREKKNDEITLKSRELGLDGIVLGEAYTSCSGVIDRCFMLNVSNEVIIEDRLIRGTTRKYSINFSHRPLEF